MTYQHRAAVWQHRVVDSRNPPRVLVVDDNHSSADALTAFLQLSGYECEVAFGGQAAIGLASSWDPDVIVMDISMPECNGYQASAVIRQDDATRKVAIIAFTALDEREVIRNIRDSEFDAYCQKGQSPTVLISIITSLTNH